MIRYKDECRSCAVPGYPCIGSACSYRNVPHYYCDLCDSEEAVYKIEGECYCEKCANKYIQETFDDFTMMEKAELLDMDFTKID